MDKKCENKQVSNVFYDIVINVQASIKNLLTKTLCLVKVGIVLAQVIEVLEPEGSEHADYDDDNIFD